MAVLAIVLAFISGAAASRGAKRAWPDAAPRDSFASGTDAADSRERVERGAAIALQPEPELPLSSDGTAQPKSAATERELRDAFVRRARAEPGALESIAAAVLASDGPKSEKVALLRALDDTHSPQTVAWLERAACSLPDESSREGESVPSFAIGRLSERPAHDADATSALARLAFDSRDLAVALRRRAAAQYAARCPPHELAALGQRLALERDDLVRAGILAALQARESEPAARRLLDLNGPPAGTVPVATDGGGES